MYGLTAAGRRELGRWLGQPTPVALELRNERFLKIALARRLEGVSALDVVVRERRACFERLHEVSAAKTDAERDSAPPGLVLLFELAVLKLEAVLKWLDRCEETLSGKDPP